MLACHHVFRQAKSGIFSKMTKPFHAAQLDVGLSTLPFARWTWVLLCVPTQMRMYDSEDVQYRYLRTPSMQAKGSHK